jgi:hypothetical protein
MLLDFVGGPQHPRFSFMPLPSSGQVGNTIPLLTVHAALAWIHSFLPEKLLLLAPIVLGGIGVARFAIDRLGAEALPAAYGGTLYAANPFVYDRLISGQLHLLLGYGLLPWAFGVLVRALEEPTSRRTLAVALWLAVLTAVNLHVAGMFVLLVFLGCVFGARRGGLRVAAGSLALAALLSAYWLVPSLFAQPGPRIGIADLEVYASRPDGPAVFPVLLGLHGFWRDEFAGATERVPALALLLVPILTVAAIGAGHLARDPRRRPWALALVVAAVVALFAAAGTSFSPTAGVFRWAVEHLPFAGIYREPQKLVTILVLAYSVFGAVGVSVLVRAVTRWRGSRGREPLRTLAVAVLTACTLVYAYPIMWGLWGEASLVRFPDDWEEADATMQRTGSGRILVLPWTLYGVWSFAGRRILANPADSFFSGDVLSGDEAGFPDVPTQTRDPFSAYVATVLERRDDVRAFGSLIAPLGVRYVVLLHEIDWREYGFLGRQPDLTVISTGPNLDVYENEAWRGEILPLSAARSIDGPEDVIGGPEEARVTERAFLAAALVPRAGDGLPAVADLLPAEATVPASSSSHVATGVRCTDGWRLGDEKADCLLGAVAAFPRPAEPAGLRTGLTGTWVIGYSVSALTLAAMFAYRRFWASWTGTDGRSAHRRRARRRARRRREPG